MTKSCSVVLKLLRKVFDKGYVCSNLDDVDWADVINVASEQGVLGVCFEAVEMLPEDQRPDLDNLMEWLGQVEYQVAQYQEHKKVIEDLSDLLGKNSLSMMILKGFGLSLNYPVPEHRPTGDIDILLVASPYFDKLSTGSSSPIGEGVINACEKGNKL